MSRPNRALVQNSGATGSATTYANPNAVPDGVIAAFDQDGNGLDMSAAAPAQFKLVLGSSTTEPIVTSLLTKADCNFYKQDYVAPVFSKITISGFPTGPTGGATYGVQIMDLSKGSEPYTRKLFTEAVAASQSVEDTIAAFIADMNSTSADNGFFNASSNLVRNIEVTGTSGTANITIGGVDYLATFDTDLDTTAANFVTAHAADILAEHGITVTNPSAPSADLSFESSTTGKGHADATIANVSGNLAGTESDTTATTQLIVTAREATGLLAAQFQEYLEDISMTATVTARLEGSGSYAQVYDLERNARGTFGRYYEETNLLGSQEDPPVSAVAGTNYDMYTIMHKNSMDLAVNRSFEYQEIVLAFATGVTGTLNTFLGVS